MASPRFYLGALVLGATADGFVAGEAVLQRLFGGALELGVDGRLDRERFRCQRLHADQRLGLAHQVIDEVKAGLAPRLLIGLDAWHRRDAWIDRIGAGDLVFLHAFEHVGEALAGALRITVRAKIGRALGHRRKHRAFSDVELRCGLLEIAACRHVDAPGAAAEVDRVDVDLENLVLAERLVDARGHDHLADLALVADVVTDQKILGDLLGDGRAALRPPGLCDVGDEGADQAALVDALVLIEALVFRGNESVRNIVGKLRERHPLAALIGLKQLGEFLALAVEYHAGAGQLQIFQLVVVRQVVGDAVVELDHRLEVEARRVERIVAAELFVGGGEVVEVDAAERLDLAGDGLRIGERRVDQRVEIEILDVERLAHVRTAVLEKLYDLRLIVDGIEFGLQRFRTRRHLRKRERGGKHLDEDQIHRAVPVLPPCVSGVKDFVVVLKPMRQEQLGSRSELIALVLPVRPRTPAGFPLTSMCRENRSVGVSASFTKSRAALSKHSAIFRRRRCAQSVRRSAREN